MLGPPRGHRGTDAPGIAGGAHRRTSTHAYLERRRRLTLERRERNASSATPSTVVVLVERPRANHRRRRRGVDVEKGRPPPPASGRRPRRPGARARRPTRARQDRRRRRVCTGSGEETAPAPARQQQRRARGCARESDERKRARQARLQGEMAAIGTSERRRGVDQRGVRESLPSRLDRDRRVVRNFDSGSAMVLFSRLAPCAGPSTSPSDLRDPRAATRAGAGRSSSDVDRAGAGSYRRA